MIKIGRDIAILIITAFFAVMWGLLLRQNLSFEDQPSASGGYKNLLEDGQEVKVTRMGVFYGHNRVGMTVSTVRREGEKFRVSNQTRLDVNSAVGFLAQRVDNLDVEFSALMGAEKGLESMRLNCEQLNLQITGVRRQDELLIRGEVGDQPIRRSLDLGGGDLFGQMLSPVSGMPPLESLQDGTTWSVNLFNPLMGGFQKVTGRYEGGVQKKINGKPLTIHKIVFDTASRSWNSYVNDKGEVLMQGSPYGLRLVREDMYPLLRELVHKGDLLRGE